MPRRPGGTPSPVEGGLRKLVLGAGPSSQNLLRDHSREVQAIMHAAQPPPDWSLDDKATAILSVIYDAIHEITNPRWRSATLAAFRVPFDQYRGPANDSVAARWRELARRDGAHGKQIEENVEKYRGYWMTAAHHLAKDIERRFRLLNNSPDGWKPRRPTGPQPPPLDLPISIDRSDILYTFDGYRGTQSYTHRWITAHGDCDHYDAVAWYFSQPDAPVEIIPMANCELDGPLRDLPMGGRCGTLKFARTLHAGDKYFFAYATKFNSDLPSRPTILHEARPLSMRSLTIRAQFDVPAIPTKCWRFDAGIQIEVSRVPEDDAPELLEVASNGYVEHTFDTCERGRKYGIRWLWPQAV